MRSAKTLGWFALAAPLLLGAALAGESSNGLMSSVPANPFAYIPPQCYTRTVDAAGAVHNPCSTCHAPSAAPNDADDGDLQTVYDFPAPALQNPWFRAKPVTVILATARCLGSRASHPAQPDAPGLIKMPSGAAEKPPSPR